MRNNLPLSFAVWATAALTALSFAACAKAVNTDLYDDPVGTADGGNGANTQPASGSGSGSSSGSSSGGTASNGSDDGGSTGSSGDDSGSTSGGDDSGGSATPEDSGGASSGGQDANTGTPSSPGGGSPQSACPMNSYYENEFDNASSGTVCFKGSDCSATQCCYLALVVDGLCVDL